jgi:hypothetical protein
LDGFGVVCAPLNSGVMPLRGAAKRKGRLTYQCYQHLSPAFLAEAVNKLDGVFVELRYQDVTVPKMLIAEASVSA